LESREISILKKIRLETGKKINTMFSGSYRSAFKGYGLLFESVREYISGDDVRNIDWNVSARMNHLYVREYIEERELSIVLMVDISASTQFGLSRNKSDVMLEFVTLMLYLAQMNSDRISLLLFSDRVEKFIKPRKGRKFVLKVLDEIINTKPEGRGTDISCAVDFLNRVMKKRSIVFAVSDFMDKKGEYTNRLKLLSRKHDVIPVQVYDPLEKGMLLPGLTELYDLESGKTFFSDYSPYSRDLSDTGFAGSLRLSTSEPIESPVLKFFEKRRKGKSR
jgi:uncharacterized protein (DUF58 family)